jgi:hypothetical protein
MKASALIQGRRAIRRVKLPLANAGHLLGSQSSELTEAQREAGVSSREAPDVGIRALTGWEWAEVLRLAGEFAAARGGKSEDADELYQLGKMAHAMLYGCVDPDDPEHGPFFDGGVDQILNSIDLGRDGIAYLYEQIEMWQDITAPQLLRLDGAEVEGAITELAGPEESSLRFFTQLRPGTRWRFMRSMASMLQILLSSRSGSGSESADASENGANSQSDPPTADSEVDLFGSHREKW